MPAKGKQASTCYRYLNGPISFGDFFGTPILDNLDFENTPDAVYLVEDASTQKYEGSCYFADESPAIKVVVEQTDGPDSSCEVVIAEAEVSSPDCSNEILEALCEEMSLSFDEEGVPVCVIPSVHFDKLHVRYELAVCKGSNKEGECGKDYDLFVAASIRGVLRALDAVQRVIETVEVYPEYASNLVDVMRMSRKERLDATFDEMEIAAAILRA